MAKLTFVLEDGQEVVVPLKEHITIGRDEDNDILVDDERISPHHAEIVENADGSLQVFDLKSAAGTFVNGERQLSCTLLHGDTLAFGPLVGTLDLEHPATTAPPVAEKTPEPAPESPAPAAPPPKEQEEEAAAPPDRALAEAVAKLEADKARLKAEVDTVEKELHDWQQRAEKERALHLARVESLRAEEEKLAPAKAAVKQAETAHHEWLEAINTLTSKHDDKTAALERLNSQHYEKSTEVQRLTTTANDTRQEIETLEAQRDAAAARLKQVRDECEQDEGLLNSLRQQIIEHEQRIVEEEAKHAAITTASLALSSKQQRDEAAVKDLEALLMTLEQNGAAAEGSLQHVQQDLATHEKELAARHAELTACKNDLTTCSAELAICETSLAARSAELATCETSLAARSAELVTCETSLAARSAELVTCETSLATRSAELVTCETSLATRSAELAAETKRLAEAQAQRAALEQQSQALANAEQQIADARKGLAEAKAQRAEIERQCVQLEGTKQQLADARQRLAAVEQRYRDVQGGSQMAPPKRHGPQQDGSKNSSSSAPEHSALHAELVGQIEAARRELAELQSKIVPLRESHSAHVGDTDQAAPSFPSPHVVHVETIRLAPIPIKSERTRGPGTKKAAAGTGKSK